MSCKCKEEKLKKRMTSLRWQSTIGFCFGTAFTLIGAWAAQFNLSVGLLSIAVGLMWHFLAIDSKMVLVYLALKRDKHER